MAYWKPHGRTNDAPNIVYRIARNIYIKRYFVYEIDIREAYDLCSI